MKKNLLHQAHIETLNNYKNQIGSYVWYYYESVKLDKIFIFLKKQYFK